MISTRKLVLISLFIAVALVLSYLENLIPLPIAIPGLKLGLPNVVILVTIVSLGNREGFLILVLRIILAGFMFGNLSAILYALAGGLLSFTAMALLNRYTTSSLVVISVVGAACHNLGQVIVAALVVSNLNLFLYYCPPLLILSIPLGLITGVVADLVVKYLNKMPYFHM